MANIPAFVMGFLATAFQIFLLREFFVHFDGNELTFGFVLASWLFWGGLGSILAPRLKLSQTLLDRLYYLAIFLFLLSLMVLRFSRFALGLLPGELTGMGPALIFSFGICFLSSFPLGGLFVLNAGLLDGNASRIYVFESLGAATAGLLVDQCLVSVVSNWQGTALVGAAAAVVVFFTFGRKKRAVWLISILAGLTVFALFDMPSQRFWWRPFNLIRSRDTLYGKLQMIRTGDELTLYSSGQPVFSFPNPEVSEESVHFALLQEPEPRNVLLIGGGAGGGLAEVLKYGPVSVDYVELDPGIIRMARDSLPEQGKVALDDPRVHISFEDGRTFLQKTDRLYDAILLNLPEPASARINRFYTQEFFNLAKSRLVPAGVFSFVVASSENYIGRELQQFLASLYGTLRTSFSEVKVVPGNTNVFLASSSSLAIGFEELKSGIEKRRLQTSYVAPELLFSRLNPLKADYLKNKVEETPPRINRDLVPVSYYFYSLLWSTQFQGLGARVLRFFSKLSSFWLLGGPLVAYILVLLMIAFRRGRAAGRFLVPLWTMGLTTIVVELAVVIAFQAFHGYVYGKISLLLACFMFGLFLGSWTALRKKRAGLSDLVLSQGGFLVLLALLRLTLGQRLPEIFLFLTLAAFGSLGGYMFVVSSKRLPNSSSNIGLGYGLDLLGSFFGAVLAAAFIIPLVGVLPLLDWLFVLNFFALLFIFRIPICRRTASGIPDR